MAVQFVNNQFIWGSMQAVTKAVIGQSNSYTGDYTTYINGSDGLHVYGNNSTSSNTLLLVDYGDSNKVVEATPLPRFRAGDISGVGSNTFIEVDGGGFDVYNGSDARFTVNGTTGNVGIGVSSPGAQLEIADSSNSSSGLRFTSVQTGGQDTVNMHFQGTAGTAPFYISRKNTGGAEMQLQADGDLILNGNNGDNVGIGTTNPQQKLDVNGAALLRGNVYFTSGTSNYYNGVGGGFSVYTQSTKRFEVDFNGYLDVPAYGDGDYLGASTSANLLKTSAGFSGSGRMLEASKFYITKLEPGGWPTASGAAAGVNVTPTPTSSQKMFIKNIYINKTSSADGSGWGNEEHPVEFTMQNDQGSYDIISGVNKNIVTSTTTWYAQLALPGFVYNSSLTPNVGFRETAGGIGKPLQLQLYANGISNEPTWYIIVEYILWNMTAVRNNPDQTLT